MKSHLTTMAIFIAPLCAFADHPTISIEGGTAGPITTVSAITPPKGTFGFSLQSQVIFNDEIPDDDLRRFSLLDEDIHSTESIYSLGASAIFSPSDNIALGLTLPYIWRTNLRETGHHNEDEAGESDHHEEDEHSHEEEGEVERLGDSDGIGDMTIYGKLRFYNDSATDRHASLIAGLKIPTGRTQVRTLEGELFEAEHQPGSGSWDPLVGFAFTQHLNRWSFDANVLYTFATRGTQDTNLGDIFNYNLAVSYRVLNADSHETDPLESMAITHHNHGPTWDLLLEVNGDWRKEIEVGETSDNNTGGNIVYLSAGSKISFWESWAASALVGIPVVENLNGFQSEPKARVLLGISKAF